MEPKRLLRSRLIAARTARTADDRAAAGHDLRRHGLAAWAETRRVAAYAGVATEPPTRPLLDALRDAGVEVLLPVITGDDLRWAPYDGWDALVVGARGLLEPTTPASGGEVLTTVDVVAVPALAVDRHGNRIGRGRGYYDRALAAELTAQLVAVVFDQEVLDEVPHESHDVRVSGALTPSGLLRFDG